jgi:PhnB protein
MITTCIHFQGNCEEAINFYKEALAAEVKEVYYAKDAPPNSGMDSLSPSFVMHSEVIIRGVNFALTDGGQKPVAGESFSFLITCDTAEEVTAIFEKIAVGGKVDEPLAPVFWSELFGQITDRFGVIWQVMVRHP